MNIVCIRGDSILEEQDLRTHLAAMLRLENVSVLLGAGASVSAGGLTILQLWKNFIRYHQDSAARFAKDGFIDLEDTTVENFEGDSRRELPNIEILLDQLEIAKIDWLRRVPRSRKLKIFQKDISRLLQCVVKAAILNEDSWKKAPVFDQLPHHVKLLQCLVGARQPGQASPWMFTTNYDRAFKKSEQATKDGNTECRLPEGTYKHTIIGEAAEGAEGYRIPYYALGRQGLNRLLLPSEKTQRPALAFAIDNLKHVHWHADQGGASIDGTNPVFFDDCRQNGSAFDADKAITQLRSRNVSLATKWPHMLALSALVAESYSITPNNQGKIERNGFQYGSVAPLITRIHCLVDDGWHCCFTHIY